MITDERLDQLIRRSLEWDARRASATQPSLGQASSRLAQRLGPAGAAVGPRLILTPAGAGGLNWLVIAILLLALIASVAVVGSLILRTQLPDLRTSLFRNPTDCVVALRTGVVFELGIEFSGTDLTGTAEDENITLWADGTLVRNPIITAETRVERIQAATFPQRRLAAAGVEQLMQRIADAGLTPGCQKVRTSSAGGRISALTRAGYAEVFWGVNVTNRPLARLLDADEEVELNALAADLRDPDSWLPEDAWIDATERGVQPDQWLVWVAVRPTEHAPGDRVELVTGDILDGVDPRYDDVVLPGGVGLLDFGADMPVASLHDRQFPEQRCALLATADALALAASLDSLELGTDAEEELFSPDLTRAITTSIEPAYPAVYGCDALATTLTRPNEPTPTSPAPFGDYAAVDPCTLVPSDAAAQILATKGQAVRPSRLPLGVPANACVLFDAELPPGDPFSDPYYETAMVTLYPRRVDRDLAERIALNVFGAATGEGLIAGHPVWTNNCFQAELTCQWAVMAWTGRQLIGFEFTDQSSFPDGPPIFGEPGTEPVPRVTSDMARQLIQAVLENVAGF